MASRRCVIVGRRRSGPTQALARAFGIALAAALAAPALAQQNPAELMRLGQAATDPATAAGTIPTLRSSIITAPDSTYAGIMRQLLIRALANTDAPAREIAAAAYSAVPYLHLIPRSSVPFYLSVSQTLAERGGEPRRALDYARRARADLPAGDTMMLPMVEENLGFVHFKVGNTDSAIAHFRRALSSTPDSQQVLYYLGGAYEKKGKTDQAIDAYIRSLAVFPGEDTTAAGALRAAYLKRHGSLTGLDTRLETARADSRKMVALEPRRHERPAPAWTLADLDGKTLASSSLAGKVVVLDFWGSWCGPCRYELPIFDAMYQRYKGRPDVSFVGINWERTPDRAQHLQLARDYMVKNKLSFPVVVDPEQKAVQAYAIQAFPTVFVIDKQGRIRYRNVGVTENIEHILEAQLESLLD